MSYAAPYVATVSETVPGQATAGTDDAWNIGRAPFAGTVESVTYAPETAITGDATNNRTLSLINKGQSGAGTTVIATLTTTATLAADDEKAIPLSETAANLVVAEGDILEWNSDANASGVADPGGLVTVKIGRSA
jgi:hypothetical protein